MCDKQTEQIVGIRILKESGKKFSELGQVKPDLNAVRIMKRRAAQCLAVSYDLHDCVISEECAQKDVAAIKHFEQKELAELKQKQEAARKREEEKQIRLKNEREYAKDVVRRLY